MFGFETQCITELSLLLWTTFLFNPRRGWHKVATGENPWMQCEICLSPRRVATEMCAGHGVELGGESPLWAELNRSISLGKGVYREVESEGSRWQSKAVTHSSAD